MNKLDFKDITIENFAFAADYVQKERITEYGIAPVCLYAPLDKAKYAVVDELVVVMSREKDGLYFGFFGDVHYDGFGDLLRGLYDEYGSYSVAYLPYHRAEYIRSLLDGYEVITETDPNQSDYIYNREDFLNLKGNGAKHKREAMRHFLSENVVDFEQIDKGKRDDCLSIMAKWCVRKDCAQCEYSCERDVVDALLTKWKLYPGVRGGIMYINGEPEAFFIGEVLGDTCIGYHQKTATTDIKGLSFAIYLYSIERLFGDCALINIGPDMGNLGLRQFKQQFKPYSMLDKYTVTIRGKRA